MLIIKIIFLIISVASTTKCLNEFNRIPYSSLTPKQNYRRLEFYYCINLVVDLVLFWIILGITPEGNYGTGVEWIVVIVFIMIYWTIGKRIIQNLCDRMRKYDDNKAKIERIMNGYIGISIVIKALFLLVETIWIIEIK